MHGDTEVEEEWEIVQGSENGVAREGQGVRSYVFWNRRRLRLDQLRQKGKEKVHGGTQVGEEWEVVEGSKKGHGGARGGHKVRIYLFWNRRRLRLD